MLNCDIIIIIIITLVEDAGELVTLLLTGNQSTAALLAGIMTSCLNKFSGKFSSTCKRFFFFHCFMDFWFFNCHEGGLWGRETWRRSTGRDSNRTGALSLRHIDLHNAAAPCSLTSIHIHDSVNGCHLASLLAQKSSKRIKYKSSCFVQIVQRTSWGFCRC